MTINLSSVVKNIPGLELLKGAVDVHVHCCPHINHRTVDLFDAVRQAKDVGMVGIGLMDVFSNSSGLAELANRELGENGVSVFGGIILEPYAGGLSEKVVETALMMGFNGGGARFVSLPCHNTEFVAKSEGRSELYIESALSIPTTGNLSDPLLKIIDMCIEADVVFNFGHLSGYESVALAEIVAKRGMTRMLCPAAYLTLQEAKEIRNFGCFLEYSFFVFSHATDVSQTMIDSELHRFPRANFDQAVDIIKTLGPDGFILSSDSGAIVLPPPIEAFREFILMFRNSGINDSDIKKMIIQNPKHLFKLS